MNEFEAIIHRKRQEIREQANHQELLRRHVCMLEEHLLVHQEKQHELVELYRLFTALGTHSPEEMTPSFQQSSNMLDVDSLPLSLQDYGDDAELLSKIKDQSLGDIKHLFRDTQAKCQFAVLHCLIHGEESQLMAQLRDRVVKFGTFMIALACSMGPMRMAKVLNVNFESEDLNGNVPSGER